MKIFNWKMRSIFKVSLENWFSLISILDESVSAMLIAHTQHTNKFKSTRYQIKSLMRHTFPHIKSVLSRYVSKNSFFSLLEFSHWGFLINLTSISIFKLIDFSQIFHFIENKVKIIFILQIFWPVIYGRNLK